MLNTSLTALSASSLATLLFLSGSPSAYSGTPSTSLHNKCLAAKDYKGCIEAQSPQKEVFNSAVAYEQCYEYMRKGITAAATKQGLNYIDEILAQIPEMCNETVILQQQGYSFKTANSIAKDNNIRRLKEQQRQRKEVFNSAVAYEQCNEYMRQGITAEAARRGDPNGIGYALPYIPEMCKESVMLQQQGYSFKVANSTALANQIRRLDEQRRQRDDQFTRDIINAPNPYLP